MMALFCFRVAETVIINVKGELLGNSMKELLMVCVRGLIILKSKHTMNPYLYLVMN